MTEAEDRIARLESQINGLVEKNKKSSRRKLRCETIQSSFNFQHLEKIQSTESLRCKNGEKIGSKELDALRENLRQLKGTLENQREKAQNELFDNFLEEIMKIDLRDDKADNLRQEYLSSLSQLADESAPLNQRISTFLNSDFLVGVLTHKNLRYEREIKRFLTHLNDLMISISKEGTGLRFLGRLLQNALNGVLDIVEPSEAKNHEQVASMIVGALKEPLKQWFR